MNPSQFIGIFLLCFPLIILSHSHKELIDDLPTSKQCSFGSAIQSAECLSQKQEEADQELYLLYQKINDQVTAPSNAEPALSNTESKQFIPLLKRYRIVSCTIKGALEGGDTVWRNVWSQMCELDFTVQQIQQLKHYIEIK